MVGRFLFKNRDGRTPLPEDFKRDLIPKNIVTGAELDELEEENIIDGLVWLEDCNGNHLDWMFWEKLHKKLFYKVWKWAGKLRQVELQNEEFNHPRSIAENIKRLEGDLKFWLTHNSFKDPRQTIARFHEQLLTIHPFTNGNGRTIRILTDYICKQEKISMPNWGKALRKDAKKHRDTYIAAVQKARTQREYSDLVNFMWN